MNILHDFAESSGRYHNINVIVNKNSDKDCIKRWKEEVDAELYQKRVSQRKKQKIEKNAEIAEKYLGNFAVVHYILEEGDALKEIRAASRETGIWEAVAPYRQLYMLQIVRFFVEILINLSYKAMEFNCGGQWEIPYFSEIFGIFYNSDAYFRGRKTWD
ncbi:MAG: hypothetical protein HFI68_06660 [Lachnospiraceae bacterium]|nr:hypothetical protein [Lachnospiraceae bacterium]